MAKLTPYLNFDGKCREAMTFYHDCLGGELVMQRIAESPMAAQFPPEAHEHIVHSTLTNGNVMLMGSDMMGASLVKGNAITLCLDFADEEEVNTFFTRLSSGGYIRMPLHQTFWGATSGELTDRFGVNWMFNLTKT